MPEKPTNITHLENILDITLNQAKNITSIKKSSYVLEEGEVIALHISGARSIIDFSFLSEFKYLRHLILINSNIIDLYFVRLLNKLVYLDLSHNQISDIENLNDLKELKHLDLSDNRIYRIDSLSKMYDLEVLILSKNKLTNAHIKSKFPENLRILDLSQNDFYEFPYLEGITNLTELNLFKNRIVHLPHFYNLMDIHVLNLSENRIIDISNLKSASNLIKLFLNGNEIENISSLRNLRSLRYLNLRNNILQFISESDFINLTNLEILDLADTNISDIDFLSNLKSLIVLNVSKNNIKNIYPLKEITSIRHLDISYNNVKSIAILQNSRLKDLNISGNPIESIDDVFNIVSNGLKAFKANETIFAHMLNLELKPNENHINIILNWFNINKSDGENIEGSYPVKVLLLGNHGSGKSQFLNYIVNEKLLDKSDSTDIIQIKPYKTSNKNILPKAIFYDFGGQDFYHGIYRIFLSNQSIYCLLWHEATNSNSLQDDINGNKIQNFNLDYWIGQKKYIEQKDGVYDDLLLIETHSDIKDSKRPTYYINSETCKIPNHQFYVSLKFNNSKNTVTEFQKINLMHLKLNLLELIDNKKTKFTQKYWYINFIKHVTSTQRKAQATNLNELVHFFTALKGNKNENYESLQTELEQLHRKGLILYYKEEIPDFVWLNPLKIVNYIKENVLIFEEIKINKGIVQLQYFKDKNIDYNILKLLELQKVIFHHLYGLDKDKKQIEEYIIPNYLPLVDKSLDYDLFTFGIHENHVFTLKFLDFIPLGLINQIICFFGRLPDYKRFWRNQILFTFEKKSKVLINLDNINLEIKVHVQFITNDFIEQENIIKYLYSCILSFYWDNQLITYFEYIDYINSLNSGDLENADLDNDYRNYLFHQIIDCEIPTDLFLSTDDINFIEVKKFSEIDVLTDTNIISYKIDENRLINFSNPKETTAYLYKNFTNKNIKKMKKVFVSYSHTDFKAMEKLTEYLIGFVRNKEIESWTDGKLQSGVKVKEEILKNLDEADIVILLISQAFIASDFIYDYELQNTMKNKINGKTEIIPVVLSSSTIFDLKLNVTGDEGTMHEIKMGEYYFIPQDENRNLKPIEEWEYSAKAWMKVYDDLKLKLNLR